VQATSLTPPATSVTLEYSFAASAPDSDADPASGEYEAVISGRFTSGASGATAWNLDPPANGIEVENAPGFDRYELDGDFVWDQSTPPPTPPYETDFDLDIVLNDSTGAAFSSDELPPFPIELQGFDYAVLYLSEPSLTLEIDRMEIDACPYYSTTNNVDTDANGIGDECECGDQTGDGSVDVLDLIAINRAIFTPALVTPLCDTTNDGLCDVRDLIGANLKIFGRPAYCSRYPPPGQ
jgi:hypothetical protein